MVEGEQTLKEIVDQLYIESDKRLFEILHRMAEYAISECSQENDL